MTWYLAIPICYFFRRRSSSRRWPKKDQEGEWSVIDLKDENSIDNRDSVMSFKNKSKNKADQKSSLSFWIRLIPEAK
ncbi:hypothetical protein COLO4_06629 [Corchorus olitorius]|uniref:Uncharacterized protein n=1 Tax=Corchorus olitorius TaxID=93759 RepID=A0A1R3KMF4_9ROSI|nr:hypothetical protein COLO4_06629 [Corchorus olitorius]